MSLDEPEQIQPRSPELAEKLKAVPTRPGVYLMRDAAARVIYVGKAQSLRSRIRQYFQDPMSVESPRIRHLMGKIRDFEFVACANEVEALILETNLIKRHRPFYNVRMADDKAFPYLKITYEDYPKIVMTRKVVRDGGRYFGPYPYHEPKLVGRTIRTVRKLFKLRTCKIEITRDLPRPCLDYYIGQCTAPCVAWGATAEQYQEQVKQAVLFLQGKQEPLIDVLRREMEEAAEGMQFERAARLRDQIQGLEAIFEKQKIVTAGQEDRDVVALAVEGDQACVQMFYVRTGKLVGQEHFMLEGTRGAKPEEALRAFIEQYYEAATSVPREVLLQTPIEDQDLIAEWLTARREGNVEVLVPQKGEKRRLVEMAVENASLFLQQERVRLVGMEGLSVKELQDLLGLEQPPFRIEAYDISNFQGGESVGSLVVCEGGRPKKDAYRRFKIKWTEGPDDYAMLQEVLRRRFEEARREQERLDRDEPVKPKWSILPDLLLIDGGRGQLNAGLEVLFEYNQSIPAIGLAKRAELIFTRDHEEPMALPRDSQALRLVQRIRDEAHRFANTYHQKLRERKIVFSVLDEIPGVGEKRKRDLIRHFGSVRKVRGASREDLAAVVGPKTADKILAHLQAQSGDQAAPAEPGPAASPDAV
ncbi:MAG: excinuclease ABC subunit UvrC [Armatimonadetes bacterium]|nr:excinuclease ABC subunit UvrC [Armatimonadota bacterium]